MLRYHKTRSGRWTVQTASFAAAGFLAAALATPASAVSLVKISGHVPELVKQSVVQGVLPAEDTLSIAISLPLQNKTALKSLLKGLNDPSDARYGHYLTAAELGKQFGPSQAQYDAVIAYAQSKGLNVSQTFPSRTYLTLSGTSSQIDSAFGVTLKQFKAPDGRIFHAPDTEVRVPSTVAASIEGVVGLDDANPPRPMTHLLRRVNEADVKAYAPDAVKPRVQDPGEQGTGPGGGFGPADLKTAYSLNGTTLNGAGQTIAMVEYGTKFNIKDILRYENQFGLPRPLITAVPVDGGPTAYTGAATETNLDIDMQIAMAPGAAQILVFLQGNTGANTDALNAVLTDGRAKQLSVSYGFGQESASSTTPSANQLAYNTVYTALAAAGVSVYVSAGDDGDTNQNFTTGVYRFGVDLNSSQPMVCSVGGTALTVQTPNTPAGQTYKAESTWNYNGTIAGGATGGGVSKQWTIAANAPYQANAAAAAAAVTGSNVSATQRNIPDISCVGATVTGVAIYSSVDPTLPGPGWYVFGGTSASAPLWAGFNALVNQNRARLGLSVLGFPNNSLYPLAYTSSGLTGNYTTLFHDINDGSSNFVTITNSVNYKAVTGYDASTGLGSFNGIGLLAALSGPTP